MGQRAQPYKQYYPFRGATLPQELTAKLESTMETFGAAHLLRAMVLAWESLPVEKQEAHLAQAVTMESAVEALGDMDARQSPPTKRDVERAVREWEVTRKAFDERANAMTLQELGVLRMRLLRADPPTYEQVAEALGLSSRGHAQMVEKRGVHKLMRWLVALLAAQRQRS